MSLISVRLVSPKFLLLNRSCSLVRQRSPSVMMPIFCRQIAAADRQLEIGHGDAEHLAHTVAFLLRVLVVVHIAGGLRILRNSAARAWVGKLSSTRW